MSDELRRVSIGDLNKRIGPLLDEVIRGERFVVCRHRRPVATLQPLDGAVVMPDGSEQDINGSPLGDLSQELVKLSPGQKSLLRDGILQGRVVTHRYPYDANQLEQDRWNLQVRGLVKESACRGIVLTGRGLMLREELLNQVGVDPTDCWLEGKASSSP